MATLRDIARHANTSVTTVSLVLNGNAGAVRISEATRQQVLEAARTLGYSPNIMARRLRGTIDERGTFMIGVLLPLDERLTITLRSLGTIRRKLDDWAREAGAPPPDVLIETYRGGHLDQVESLTRSLRYNGVILYNTLPTDDQWLASVGPLMVPLVLVQRSIAGHSWVNTDNRHMGMRVAAHLLQHGQRLAAVTPAVPAAAQSARVEGFAQHVFQETGIAQANLPVVRGAFSEAGGYEATRRLLADLAGQNKPLPTGLFVTADLMAVGALRMLKEAALRIPNDIAVVGYDDDPFAPFTDPPLSTVNASLEASAERAVDILLTLIQTRSTEPITHLLDSQLVLRQSSAVTTEPQAGES